MNRLLRPSFQARANSGLSFRPDANTVLWLPGQDDAYSSTIRDRSGKGNNGTITGATWAQTSQGLWYLDFDGNNQKTEHGTGASLNINYPLTLICWFRVTNTANRQWLMSKADPGSALVSHCNYGLQVYNNRVWGLAGDGTSANEATNSTPFNTNTWTFTAYSLSATKVPTTVVNGVAQTTTQVGFEPAKDAYAFWTGASNGDVWDVTGGIALLRVLNKALSSSELEEIRSQERHLFGV